ncbi:MAG: glucosylceramidase [Candidatus Doudnabacteria bacterium]|nr:glucosylceramidase [Candidatus Doudnabacteria bacterium]
MRLKSLSIALLLVACSSTPVLPPIVITPAAIGPKVNVWLTNSERSSLLSPVASLTFKKEAALATLISVDTTVHYQSMDGFGYTLTGGSAQLMNTKMSSASRAALLKELFTTDQNGIGVSYLRISIGASDLDDHVFSYNDLTTGQTDVNLTKFSLDEDRKNLIPILKEIVALFPQIKILGSPWSAPAWMKTNNLVKGGSLKTEYYTVYANYLTKYIQTMAQEGITIDAITTQNEPEHPGNTPSMTMTSSEQSTFIKSHLSPAFKAAGLSTKIILYDHNCDHPNYPISILDDGQTKPLVDGSAFHLYAGDISALSTVHAAHPDKNVYFTEQWTSGNGNFGGDLQWHVKNLIVGAPRNWSKNVLEWNLAADENLQPHTDGGCNLCLGALTITSAGTVIRNVSYYIIGHASKFVPPGSTRVQSNITDNLYNVAFVTPDGKKALIVVNDSGSTKSFSIGYKGMNASASLAAGAVATYVW